MFRYHNKVIKYLHMSTYYSIFISNNNINLDNKNILFIFHILADIWIIKYLP